MTEITDRVSRTSANPPRLLLTGDWGCLSLTSNTHLTREILVATFTLMMSYHPNISCNHQLQPSWNSYFRKIYQNEKAGPVLCSPDSSYSGSSKNALKFYLKIRFVLEIKKFWFINENAFKIGVKYIVRTRGGLLHGSHKLSFVCALYLYSGRLRRVHCCCYKQVIKLLYFCKFTTLRAFVERRLFR